MLSSSIDSCWADWKIESANLYSSQKFSFVRKYNLLDIIVLLPIIISLLWKRPSSSLRTESDDRNNVSISLEQTGMSGCTKEDGRGKGGRRVSMATSDPRHRSARPGTRLPGTVELQGAARLCVCVCVSMYIIMESATMHVQCTCT
jgi:hypothetical protein